MLGKKIRGRCLGLRRPGACLDRSDPSAIPNTQNYPKLGPYMRDSELWTITWVNIRWLFP
jgi:hypothetical protein